MGCIVRVHLTPGPANWSRSAPQLTGLPDTPYSVLAGGLTGGLTGAILVGYPIRELYNKVCAALDAVARQAVDPIRAAINAHAAAIAGVLTTSWLVARDWPLRLCNGVAGGVAYCLVAARQRRLQGAAARR